MRIIRHLRWYIAGMLMLATTINYLDRQTLSVAQVVLEEELNLSSSDYATIVASFQFAYGLMLPVGGRLMDWLGLRRGFTLCVLWWSLANMAHAFARGVVSLSIFRLLLGLGEAGNFPGSVKAVSQWFPARERATATGIFNLGAGTGALIAPPLVGWMILSVGWQWTFVATGALGFVWAAAWLYLYREPARNPHLSAEELAYIREGDFSEESAAVLQKGSWKMVLTRREIWPLIIARILSDPVWLFYLFWLPHYFKHTRGFNLVDVALFGWVPFLAADLGSVSGGWLSSFFVRRGLSVLAARKAAMCIFAALMPMAVPAVLATHWQTALLFISVATFGHQAWSASFITLPADLFPKPVVASAYGLAAMCGFFAGAVFTKIVGHLVDSIGYVPVFTTVGLLHLLATAVLVVGLRGRKPGFPGRASGFPVISSEQL